MGKLGGPVSENFADTRRRPTSSASRCSPGPTALKLEASVRCCRADSRCGSVLRVRAVEKRSPARREPPQKIRATAVPRTDVIQAIPFRRAERLLDGRQREYGRCRPSAAPAALLPLKTSAWMTAAGLETTFGTPAWPILPTPRIAPLRATLVTRDRGPEAKNRKRRYRTLGACRGATNDSTALLKAPAARPLRNPADWRNGPKS